MGAANIAAGFFQGFAVSTSGSRTAVAEQSGAKSQLTGVVGAGLVAVLLLFLNSLLADLPQTALAAVVIAAALSLVDLAAARAATCGSARAPCACRWSPRLGVVAARRAAGHRRRRRPGDPAVLPPQLVAPRRGARPGRGGRGVAQRRRASGGAEEMPDVVVYRWEAPLFFANAGSFRQQVRHLVRDAPAAWVVLQCEAITDIDVTAAEMLEQLDNELNARASTWPSSEMRTRLQDLVAALRPARDARPRPLLPDARGRYPGDPIRRPRLDRPWRS